MITIQGESDLMNKNITGIVFIALVHTFVYPSAAHAIVIIKTPINVNVARFDISMPVAAVVMESGQRVVNATVEWSYTSTVSDIITIDPQMTITDLHGRTQTYIRANGKVGSVTIHASVSFPRNFGSDTEDINLVIPGNPFHCPPPTDTVLNNTPPTA
jgi:ABC-type sulfate transport system permease component